MLPFPNNLYAQWRLESGVVPLLHDQADPPPERLLQAVWQHQRLLRDGLRCLDGRPVRILHPGFSSLEGGPDFHDAIVQFGQDPPCSGDVEVDVHAGGWQAHGHHRNIAFQRVILHVIWEGNRPARSPGSTLVLRDQLDAPIGELGVWLNSESDRGLPDHLRGQCCGLWRQLSPEQRGGLLRDAGAIRFRGKASQFQARARQAGWEQALWEGVFRALGYKHNSWPMHCLAEQRRRWLSSAASPLELQARLLGIASLLPGDLIRSRNGADSYLRRVWDQWWRERVEFEECLLPASVWRLHGQRPANQPQRRLALAAHWLAAGDLPAKLERWCALQVPDSRLGSSLMEILQVPRDPFWSSHWTLRSPRLKSPQPLLGLSRVTDLAVNAVLPWLWIRAVEGKNDAVQQTIEHRFSAWPPAQDNSALRFARQRLLGGAPRREFHFAAQQQGCLQIGRDFCDRSDALCRGCKFPELILRNLIKDGKPAMTRT